MQCVVTSQTLWISGCPVGKIPAYFLVVWNINEYWVMSYFFYIRGHDNVNLLESVDVLYYIGWF